MATRQTQQAAQELKADFERDYPTRTFRIIDSSREMRIGRGVAEMKGYEITEDDGSIMVKVNYTEFSILEVRACRCGAEVLTKAIGEDELDECPTCRKAREQRQAQGHRVQEARERTKVRTWTARDTWEEN